MDVTDATFETEVLDRSAEVPVVVDLWATWCGPCRTLGPVLEKVVGETGGRVALAKVDVDNNPRVAATFQVSSIPAVFALKDRKVVSRFIGSIPESQVRQFVDSLVPAPTEVEQLLAAGDEASLRKAVELEPASEQTVTALASFLVDRAGDGDRAEALQLLARIPETGETRTTRGRGTTARRFPLGCTDHRRCALGSGSTTSRGAPWSWASLRLARAPMSMRSAGWPRSLSCRAPTSSRWARSESWPFTVRTRLSPWWRPWADGSTCRWRW
jgi:putative thioredoxin